MSLKRVLIIAGSDSSGGAGIQADLKTLTSFGVYGMTAITALTAQNTLGVHQIFDVSTNFIEKQMDACLSDIGVDAIKIGMVHKAEIFDIIFNVLQKFNLINNNEVKIVLDPVMFAKGGHPLLEKEAVDSLKQFIKKTKPILTPNIPEAEILSQKKINSKNDMIKSGKTIMKMGVENLILKGGHLSGNKLTDMIFQKKKYHEICSERVKTDNTHGTGCTLSTAIAANLTNHIVV